MTTAMTVTLLLLVFLVPGMAMGMALLGLIRSKFWTVIAAIALTALSLAFVPAQIAVIPVGYMFLGIYIAQDDPDLLYQVFAF